MVGKTVRLLFCTVYRIPVHRYSNARSRVYPRHRRPRLRPLTSPAAPPPPPNPRNLTVFPDRLSSLSSSSSSSSPARRSSSTPHAFAVTPPEPRRRARQPRSSTVHRRQRNRTNVSVSPPSPRSRVFFTYSLHTSRKPIVPLHVVVTRSHTQHGRLHGFLGPIRPPCPAVCVCMCMCVRVCRHPGTPISVLVET